MLVPIWLTLQSLVAGENCPAPVDVEARVRVILHLAPEQKLREGFVVERHEAGLYVELRGADSTLIGQRTLPAQGSCDELAQAAAVILSAWLSDVHPDFAGALPERAPQPEPEPEPELNPPAPPLEPKPAPPRKPPAPSPATSRIPLGWDLGLGLGSDLTGGRFTVALPFTFGYGSVASGFGVSATAIVTLARQSPLSPGLVSWRRWPFGLGPNFRARAGRLAWDFNPGVALAWLHVAGIGYTDNSAQDGPDFGGYFNVRVASRGRHGGVFGLANAQFYPAGADVHVTGVAETWKVPKLSLLLAVGVDFWP